MQFTANLSAGRRARQQTAGGYFVLLSTGAADTIELWLMDGTREIEYVRTAKKGLQARLPDARFTSVEFSSAVDATIEFVISDGQVDFDFVDGAVVHIGDEERGETLAKPLFVSGLTLEDTPATAITDGGPVAATDAPGVLLAANANRKAFRVVNLGPDEAAIGGAGLTWANRTIVLSPGFGWAEKDAAPLAWRAVCDAGKTAAFNVQELTL